MWLCCTVELDWLAWNINLSKEKIKQPDSSAVKEHLSFIAALAVPLPGIKKLKFGCDHCNNLELVWKFSIKIISIIFNKNCNFKTHIYVPLPHAQVFEKYLQCFSNIPINIAIYFIHDSQNSFTFIFVTLLVLTCTPQWHGHCTPNLPLRIFPLASTFYTKTLGFSLC